MAVSGSAEERCVGAFRAVSDDGYCEEGEGVFEGEWGCVGGGEGGEGWGLEVLMDVFVDFIPFRGFDDKCAAFEASLP